MRRFFLVMIFAVALSGCATTRDQTLVTQLQLRVGGLERNLDLKNNQIKGLTHEIKELSYEIDQLNSRFKKQEAARAAKKKKIEQQTLSKTKKTTGIIQVLVSTKNIQLALREAGYYKGAIDNKIGIKTKEAISRFQKDNGLKADGIVGEKTWDELKPYLP